MMKIVYWLRSRVCNIALKDLIITLTYEDIVQRDIVFKGIFKYLEHKDTIKYDQVRDNKSSFSDEEFYVIDEDAVVSIAPMSKEAIRMYSRWVKKEILHEPEVERGQVPITPSMGLIAKVEDARKHLEKMYKEEPERPSNP